jgi:chain length determinant protein tyrosine kinase EpsG
MHERMDESLELPDLPLATQAVADDGWRKTLPVQPARGEPAVVDRRIGEILAERRSLGDEDLRRILDLQREQGMRFGECAVALQLASRDDVLYALSQQFHYPYAPECGSGARSADLVMLNEPFSARAEAFRALRTQMLMRVWSDTGRSRRALAVISPQSGDGKTYCSANLAVALAQLGGRTLLIDADMRGPRQHLLFGLPNGGGLSAILSGRGDRDLIQSLPGLPMLSVLPVGTTPPNPLELVERPAFGLLVQELCAKFDHVVVDTPAAIYGADPVVIAARCGAALVIAREHRSRVSNLKELVGMVAGSPAQLAGVVINEF